MKVLVIAAHPDDEAFGMGGTIAKHSERKDEVYVCVLSESTSSQYKHLPENEIEKLKKSIKGECEKANKILGVKRVYFFDFPDMKLDTLPHVDVNSCIEKCILEVKPDIVYTHFIDDLNKDHRIVSESTLVAVRPIVGKGKSHAKTNIKKVLFYEIPSSTEWIFYEHMFKPNFFVNITNTLGKKMKAIESYRRELRRFPHPRSLEAVKILAKARGVAIGVKAAEAFVLVREIEQ